MVFVGKAGAVGHAKGGTFDARTHIIPSQISREQFRLFSLQASIRFLCFIKSTRPKLIKVQFHCAGECLANVEFFFAR